MTTPPLKLKLRPFQERVFQAVMNGKSVLLQAPTGAGKTRAATAPFLQNLALSGDALPLTCRYAVPLRVLASQFFNEYEVYGERIDTAMDARLRPTYEYFDQKPIQIQTGEQPQDIQFESAMTFCTIDQLLASALAIPYGLGKRSANMNVGAILGSYLVFDEFHLYPLSGNRSAWGARTTTLALLQMMRERQRQLTPFVVMTATFSSSLLGELQTILDAKIISIPPNELSELNAGRLRQFTVHDAPMNAATVFEQHTDCSLVVCNTVLRAQKIFLELQELARTQRPETQIMLLHSRFSDEDRRAKQQKLEASLGKQQWDGNTYTGPNLIMVATQVVEVGLDISARVLHSELAPANSIIQRAGRCARFAGQHGRVHLYPIAPNERGRVVYQPYTQAHLDVTGEAFSRFGKQHVGFAEEQHVVDAVHGEEDAALLAHFRSEQNLIRSKIYEGWSAHERGIASRLIRDVQQVTLLIHDDPNTAITKEPWTWQTFGMHPDSLITRWDALGAVHADAQSFGNEQPTMAWQARIDETENLENERQPTRYMWEPLAIPAPIHTALMIALAPTIATYNSDLGLVLNDGRLSYAWPEQPFRSKLVVANKARSHKHYDYEQESYIEHITRLLRAYQQSRLHGDTRYIARQFERALQLPVGAIDQAIRLAIACHDIGKLGNGWQQWALDWQALLVKTYPQQAERYQAQKYPFAHTDSEGREHRELAKQLATKRPRHACESAALAAWLIGQSIGDKRLQRATVAAIARHHNATSQEYSPITLIPNAQTYVEETLELVRHGQSWAYDLANLDVGLSRTDKLDKEEEMTLPNGDNDLEVLLYFLIVRVLRLADTRSFRYR